MKKTNLLSIFFLVFYQSYAQLPFDQVYREVPGIPHGLLEAVSFQQTHVRHITATEPEGCSGIPRVYGLMGLTLDGKNYFNENLKLVASLSGIPTTEIISDPYKNVLAYARAFDHLYHHTNKVLSSKTERTDWKKVAVVLEELSEIPDSGYVNRFARDCQLYGIFHFLNDENKAMEYGFPVHHIDLPVFFGTEKYAVLSANRIRFASSGITANGHTYPQGLQTKSTEYAPAIWNPAASCNYSSRAGVAVSAITIHTVQGTYAGAISWAQNCASSVSYHYVIRSSDGQVTQMVDEANKAWHVGSENPYTIGYEHEGYTSDASWYTTAMYTASAALSRDICSSGYGINPLRTYFGPSSSGSDVLGSCTKIKGHQHYPYQTHTDPGINWNWPYYYLLINNSTAPVVHTSASGNFYDSGGPTGNYTNDERKLDLFSPTGAGSVSLTFTAFDLENNWDYMFVYDGNSTSAPLIGTYTGTSGPGTVTSTGANLLVEFRSDCSTVNPGWAAAYTSGAGSGSTADVVAPTTAVSTPATWVSNDFNASFTDLDNTGGSGVEKSFYQVTDYNAAQWSGNAARGFFQDDFDLSTIDPAWTISTGSWGITSGALVQSDESLGNTNIYAYLNHGLSNRYLYNWAGKIEGTGTNRRAGFHYFCDDPTLDNRGNSYFIWYRLDDDKIELYKVISNTFYLQSSVPFDFNMGQWYDFKVIYDRISGKTQAYVDNLLQLTWTDASPYAGGNYISFRSGNSKWSVNNLKVYRSRAAASTVLVGPSGDLRYQNIDPLTPAGKIRTIINDNAGNLSSIISQDINVDTTAPAMVPLINDGIPADVDTWTSTNSVSAYWDVSNDPHSGVARYWYALGTAPGLSDIVGWTDNSWYDSVTVTGLSMAVGQTYYFSVKAENAAGLVSALSVSDGFTIVPPTSPPTASFYAASTIVCNGQCIGFSNTSSDATSFNWSFSGGDITSSALSNPTVCYATSGTYPVTLVASGPGGSDTLSQMISVTMYDPPAAGFAVSSDTVYLPSAFAGFSNSSSNANGYYWEFGDGQTSTDDNPWNLYGAAGVYTVSLIAANGPCTNDTAYAIVTVLNPSGVVENASQVLVIYPNPVINDLNIAAADSRTYSVQLYDQLGKLVKTISFQGRCTIEMDGMAKGIYQLRANSSGETVFRKTFVRQ